MPAFEAPVYTLKGIKIRFGSKQLFEDVELYINRGDKISLVGRNGSGKSTLLKIIAGITEPDDGEIFIQPNVKIGYMPQDADLSGFKTLREAVAAGLDKHDGSEDYKTDMWIEQLEIAADADPATASGGERRKATLARALIEEPDILLLDEPTNHLDMPTIEKLEKSSAATAAPSSSSATTGVFSPTFRAPPSGSTAEPCAATTRDSAALKNGRIR